MKDWWVSMSRWKLKRTERLSLALVVPGEGAAANAGVPSVGPPRASEEALRLAEGFKDELLGVLSHELRTPLHVISGLQELLGDEVVGSLNPDQRAYLETIGQEVDRLGRLIGDVLDAGVLSAGELPLWKEPVDLARLAEDVITLLEPRAEARGVRLVVQAPRAPERSPTVRGDESRIAQVLTRLLTNAIAFSPEGGTVGLRVSVLPGQVCVEVEDTGCGIPEPDQPKLFQRFRQIDMSLTRPHGGLGMGLFLCRRLIEAHGGRIGIKSQPGGGSTFWFTLPV